MTSIQEEATATDELCKKYGVTKKLKLGEGELGRGFFAEEDLEPGDIALQVPLDICILRQLDAADAGLTVEEAATESSPGKLSEGERRKLFWVVEVFLTMEVLMDMKTEGSFWGAYQGLLPPPDTPLPLLLPQHHLDQLRACDPDFVRRVEGHRLKVNEAWQKQVGSEAPGELGWVNACVLSRCFHIGQGTSVLAWLAPFVDMINHSFSPNCKVVTAPDAIQVEVTHKVPAGAELLFTYAHFPTAHFFWRYGFCVPDSLCDSLQFPEGAEGVAVDLRLWREFERGEDLIHASPLKAAAARSIPHVGEAEGEGEGVDVEEEAGRAEELGAPLAAAAAACQRYTLLPDTPDSVREYVRERGRLLQEGAGLCARYKAFLLQRPAPPPPPPPPAPASAAAAPGQ